MNGKSAAIGVSLVFSAGLGYFYTANPVTDQSAILASFGYTLLFLVWITIDSNKQNVEISKFKKILFFLTPTAPLVLFWYVLRTRKARSLFFLMKFLLLVVVELAALLLIAVLTTLLVSL